MNISAKIRENLSMENIDTPKDDMFVEDVDMEFELTDNTEQMLRDVGELQQDIDLVESMNSVAEEQIKTSQLSTASLEMYHASMRSMFSKYGIPYDDNVISIEDYQPYTVSLEKQKGFLNKLKDSISTVLVKIWESIKNFFKSVWRKFIGLFNKKINTIEREVGKHKSLLDAIADVEEVEIIGDVKVKSIEQAEDDSGKPVVHENMLSRSKNFKKVELDRSFSRLKMFGRGIDKGSNTVLFNMNKALHDIKFLKCEEIIAPFLTLETSFKKTKELQALYESSRTKTNKLDLSMHVRDIVYYVEQANTDFEHYKNGFIKRGSVCVGIVVIHDKATGKLDFKLDEDENEEGVVLVDIARSEDLMELVDLAKTIEKTVRGPIKDFESSDVQNYLTVISLLREIGLNDEISGWYGVNELSIVNKVTGEFNENCKEMLKFWKLLFALIGKLLQGTIKYIETNLDYVKRVKKLQEKGIIKLNVTLP